MSLPTPTARQVALPEDLNTTLVSLVTTAVTQQLSALLPPPSAASSTNAQSLSTRYPVVQSVSSDHAATLVQGALGEVHSTLSGQPHFTEQLPIQPFHSASLPLDAWVPEKIKEKIWREEFVDFGVFLSNPDPTARYELNVRRFPAGHPASLVLEPTAKSKQIRTISDIHIFVFIYTQRYSHETPALMKYCQIVQDLAARDYNWSYYDENFRFLRQTQVSQVSWETLHWELWLRSQNYSRKTSHVSSPQSLAQSPQFVLSVTVHIVPLTVISCSIVSCQHQ